MRARQEGIVKKYLPKVEVLPREKIVYSTLERQPTGWVKVVHHFSVGKKATLEICYTPDKHILRRESACDWLACYEDWSDPWEVLAIQLMDDFRNEIIPCWARLVLQTGKTFRIEVEDRQPHWTPQRGIVSSTY